MAYTVLQQHHYHMYLETAWGATPETPARVLMPLDTYGVSFLADRRTSLPQIGQYGRKHGRRYRGRPQGSMSGPLFPQFDSSTGKSKTQWLLEWVFGGETSINLPSIGIEVAEVGIADAGKRHAGMRCSQFALTGSEDSGRVDWAATATGKSEALLAAGSYQAVPDDLGLLTDFEFADCVLTIGSAVQEMKSFQITRSQPLQVHYLGSRNPSAIVKGGRETGLQLVILKETAGYDAIRRDVENETELDVNLVLKGKHEGTASDTYTTISIDMPRAQVATVTDAHSRENVSTVTIDCDSLKPDSSAAEISFTYGTE